MHYSLAPIMFRKIKFEGCISARQFSLVLCGRNANRNRAVLQRATQIKFRVLVAISPASATVKIIDSDNWRASGTNIFKRDFRAQHFADTRCKLEFLSTLVLVSRLAQVSSPDRVKSNPIIDVLCVYKNRAK